MTETIKEIKAVDLDAVMWLVRVQDELVKAGDCFVPLEELRDMCVANLASKCGPNNIKIRWEKDCYHQINKKLEP
jgi:hypothetical protein